MASTTKSTGSGHLLWPEGMIAENINNDMFLVIEHALRILSWQENLTSEECPPRWMWHLDWEIEDWFEKIKNDRDNKYGKTPTNDSDDEGLWEDNLLFNQMKESL